MTSLALLLAVTVSWKTLQSGVELATVKLDAGPLYVVRVDPVHAKLRAGLASERRTEPKTAAAWCRAEHLAVAINLGMFQTDLRSNVGYLRHGKHINNRRWNAYRSVLALRDKQPARWIDLAENASPPKLEDYDIVFQNLRLIAGPRKNVWARNDRKWSEAALAIDGKGRLLFLFTRAAYSMRDFNELLLKLQLDVTRAMHLDGGPEASLSVHAGGVDLDLAGSYESGFSGDGNEEQWALPNVLGVLRE